MFLLSNLTTEKDSKNIGLFPRKLLCEIIMIEIRLILTKRSRLAILMPLLKLILFIIKRFLLHFYWLANADVILSLFNCLICTV